MRSHLLAYVGGAHLHPENHAHHSRLNAAAFVAASCANSGATSVTYEQIISIVNDTFGADHSLTRWDDPNGNLFTQNIIFHGGNFIVLPGIDEGGAIPLQDLLSAIFLAPPDEAATFIAKIRGSTLALLSLSNVVAERAGLKRNIKTNGIPTDQIPKCLSEAAERSAKAVRFTNGELRQILREKNLSTDALDPFICKLKDVDLEIYSPTDNPLISHPLVEIEDGLVVAIPTNLSFALRSFLWAELKSSGYQELFANRLADTELVPIQQLLKLGDYFPFPEIEPLVQGQLREYIFRIDEEKLAVLHVIINDSAYGTSGLSSEKCSEWLNERRESLLKAWGSQFKLLDIIIYVTPGIEPFHSFGVSHDDGIPTIMTSSWGLWLCLSQEIPDRLDLWKFCRLRDETEKTVEFFSFGSFIDQYAFYLSKRRSFYLDDEAKPTHILLAPGNEEYLQDKAIIIPDVHLVYQPSRRVLKEVRRTSRDSIPIYMAKPFEGPLREVVEYGNVQVWVGSIESNLVDCPYSTTDLVRCFSYWTLQLCKEIPGLNIETSRTIELVLMVHPSIAAAETLLSQKETLKVDAAQNSSDAIFIEATNPVTRLHLSAPCIDLVSKRGNHFDQFVVKALYRALFGALNPKDVLNQTTFEEVVKRITADKNKRMILTLDISKRRGLDPRNLIPPRKVDGHDVDEELHKLIYDLKSEGHVEGAITCKDEQVKITRKLVRIFANRAFKLISELDSYITTEKLLASHETIVHDQVFDIQTGKFVRACYWDDDSFLTRTAEERQKLTKTGLSIRTLMEMVNAQPSTGRVPSDEEIDRLLALGELIVNWGRISDEIFYDLLPHQVSVLRNGRIGLNHSALEPHDRFYRQKFLEEIESRSQPERTTEGEKDITRLLVSESAKEAIKAEWGADYVTTFHLGEALFEIGIQFPNSVACLAFDDLVDRVKSLGIALEKNEIGAALKEFIQIPHPGAMKPPLGYEPSDIYPWRYNRLLSIMRRPLISFDRDGKQMIMFGARTVARCIETLLQNIALGFAAVRTKEMISLRNQINRIRGEDFNISAQKWFEQSSKLEITPNIEIGPRCQISAELDLGDVDLFLIDRVAKIIYSTECKEVNFAREPHQMFSEWRDVDGDWSDKHLKRDSHLKTWILDAKNTPFGDLSGYEVRSFILTSNELPTAYLKKLRLPVISLTRLAREGVEVLATLTQLS